MWMETLEQRQLLAGVTLIAHGATEYVERQAWVDKMADAIAAREPAPIFLMRVVPGESALNWQMQYLGGSGSVSSTGNAIVVLDWAAASHLDTDYRPTSAVAGVAVRALVDTFPELGISEPLASLPIHLIGHSRGGSLVSELARQLGERGVQVDQMTILDGHPVSSDAAIRAYQNVVFVDNYYQTNDSLPGSSLSGAANTNLSALERLLHMEVTDWYAGTIPASPSEWDGHAWYSGSTGPRTSIGYAWSSTGGVARPNSGSLLAGASRSGVSVTASGAARWDNVIVSQAAPGYSGNNVTFSYRAEDANGDATVYFGFDTDDNPYNGVQWVTSRATSGLSMDAWQSGSLSLLGMAAGQYRIAVRVSNGTHTRYAYSREFTVVQGSVNRPPTMTGVAGDVTVTQGQSITRSGTVSDPDGHPLTLTASRGTITRSGSTWTWTYSTYELLSGERVTLTASDGYGGMVSDGFALTVNEAPPSVWSISGSSKADRIEISVDGDYLVALRNGRTHRRLLSTISHVVMDLGRNHDVAIVAPNVTLRCSILGGTGNDSIRGGSGNDILLGGDGNDTLIGGDGNDKIRGSYGNDRLYGGYGNDSLYGDAGADYLNGQWGDDYLYSIDSSRDTVRGGSGQDRARLDRTRDVFSRTDVELLS
jgi:Ca2+-binding RTX toxin-like protein